MIQNEIIEMNANEYSYINIVRNHSLFPSLSIFPAHIFFVYFVLGVPAVPNILG